MKCKNTGVKAIAAGLMVGCGIAWGGPTSIYDAKLFSQIPVPHWMHGDKAQYVADVKAAGIDCVLPSFCDVFAFGDKRKEIFAALKDEIDTFEKEGLAVMVWTSTLGYGNSRLATSEGRKRFEGAQNLIGLEGKRNGAICSLEPKMQAYTREIMTDIAKTGAKAILIDDDFVQSARGRLGCVCPRHLERVAAKLGRKVTAAEILASFEGAPNEVRTAFVNVTGETALEYAKMMRAAVDAVNTNIVMGLCLSFTHWDVEGVDMEEMLDILAGKGHRKFMRISGATYWSEAKYHHAGLEGVIEFIRMQATWAKAAGWKVIDENDPYPRKEAEVPAWKCELYDKAVIADGLMDRHKYMLCYGPKREETSYLMVHLKNLDEDAKLREQFADTEQAGVYVPFARRKIREMTLPSPRMKEGDLVECVSFAMEATLLARCGIPVRHDVAPDSYALDCQALGIDSWKVDFANFPREQVRDAIVKAAEKAGKPIPVYVKTKASRVYLILRYNAAKKRYVALLENFGDEPADVDLVTTTKSGTVAVKALAPHAWRVVTIDE